jgi:adenosylmethionine-8-amino-7-oxononanoate aminotransferase
MQLAQRQPPLAITRGQGAWLYGEDGTAYFDAISSWWVNLLGHAHPGIAQGISAQLARLPHVMLAGCTHEPAVLLAERLSARTSGHLGHAFYGSDGASAVEVALKMSFHYWRNLGQTQKRRFICLAGSYHGETLGALGVTDVAIFRSTYSDLIQQALVIPSPACANPQLQEASMHSALAALETVLQESAAEISALILEPLVQAGSGMNMYPAEYLRRARQLCTQYSVHLIADEIAVGCGRTGRFFAWEHSLPENAQAADWPDFITLSKGITGGTLPLSVVLCQHPIYAAFLSEDIARGFLHSHSYTGNPLACAAAIATLDALEGGVLDALPAQAQWLHSAMQGLRDDARTENYRQIGCIAACDVKTEYAGAQFSAQMQLAGREHGLLIRPIGRSMYVMPPFILDADLSQYLAQTLQRSFDQALNQPQTTASKSIAI